MRTAIQLWTLREHPGPQDELFERIAAAGYDGVEFAGLSDPVETAERLQSTGLLAAGAHVDAETIQSDPAGVTDELATLGAPYVVVPYLDDDHFVDAAAVTETARKLDELAGSVEKPLLYHNHTHEFVPVGTETAFDRLLAETTVGIELDAGWARAAGRDPAALLETLSGRVPVVHLKDVTADGEPTDLGDGVVDLQAVVDAARAAGTEWLVFEHDDPSDPMASMETAGDVLSSLSTE
ncbi:sugar phosphate isomerase/epimerase family protein [Haloarcula halophila]|uniref:sugar phosphate isomerase/epimerase family protein n=1 Tax=Haloarcula TaxID=2237 RepID=UPI0023E466B0|nr:sugar phosphate isomerase/epimerase [Halomicroarcula sp. DFY41]